MDKKNDIAYRDAQTWDVLDITHMWGKMMEEIATPELRMLADGKEKEGFFYDLTRRVYIQTQKPLSQEDLFKVIVAVYRGMPCGFIQGDIRRLGHSTHWTGHCDSLYVKKELRSKKIGPKLIEELSRWFKTKGVKREQFETVYIPKLASAWLARGYKPVQIIYRKELA